MRSTVSHWIIERLPFGRSIVFLEKAMSCPSGRTLSLGVTMAMIKYLRMGAIGATRSCAGGGRVLGGGVEGRGWGGGGRLKAKEGRFLGQGF